MVLSPPLFYLVWPLSSPQSLLGRRNFLLLCHLTTETNAIARVSQVQQLRTLDPIGLWRSNATRPSCLQCLVDLSCLGRDFSALLKVETLHICHCLIDPADG